VLPRDAGRANLVRIEVIDRPKIWKARGVENDTKEYVFAPLGFIFDTFWLGQTALAQAENGLCVAGSAPFLLLILPRIRLIKPVSSLFVRGYNWAWIRY